MIKCEDIPLQELLRDMFESMSMTCKNISLDLDDGKIDEFINPKWGYEGKYNDKTFQLVLKLEELKK